MSHEPKTAIVTGASRGIGREVVKHLLVKGVQVIAFSRDLDALQSLATDSRNHEHLITCAGDITDADAHITLIEHLGGRPLDILINNAGLLDKAPFGELPIENVEAVYRTNVLGPIQLTQALLPALHRSFGAHIVNIGSMGGFQGSAKFTGLWAYSSSKAALANLTECWAEELKGTNIRCNCLALGAVNTEMLREAFPDFAAPTSAAHMGSYIADFAMTGHTIYNGKVLPVAISTP